MAIEKKFVPTFKVVIPDDLTKNGYVDFKDIDGKRIKKYTGINKHRTRPKRIEAANKLLSELTANYVCKPSMVFDNAFKTLENRRMTIAEGTLQNYKSYLRCFSNYCTGREFDKDLCEEYFDHLLTTVKKSTYNVHLTRLRGLFAYMGQEYYFEDIQKAKAIHVPAKYFQQHQIDHIMEYLDDTDEELSFACEWIYYCFCRPSSEVTKLRVEDVNFDDELVYINPHQDKARKGRYAIIPENFIDSVSRVKFGDWSDYIFPSNYRKNSGLPKAGSTLRRRHRLALKELNYNTKIFKWYSWKHTGAVQLYKDTWDVKCVQLQMGHKEISTTDLYLRQLGVREQGNKARKFPPMRSSQKKSSATR